MLHSQSLTIGLTGGFCCGKTTVAKMFGELGAKVIDADQIAHNALKTEAVRTKIVSAFGGEILKDGKINRAELGKMVFDGTKEKVEILNSIVHPFVIAGIETILRQENEKKEPPRLLIVDAPLLIEAGLTSLFSKLVVVSSDEKLQIRRAMSDFGLSEAEAGFRMSAQMPLDEKVKLADYVIENSGSLMETLTQVRNLWRRLCL